MRLSPTVLTNRFRAVADRLARGSDVPAGTDPAEREESAKRPGSRERGAIRRRLRQQRKLRDAMLMELGALVMEAHRHGRDDAAVIRSKAAEAAAVDAETVSLAETLGEGGDLGRLTATGLAAPCPSCGTLVAARARFCERCGADLEAGDSGDGLTTDDAAVPNGDSSDETAVLEPVDTGGNGDEPAPATSEQEAPR